MSHRRTTFFLALIVRLLLGTHETPAQLKRVDPLMSTVDSNADGELSVVEMRSAAAAFRRLDRDDDGLVSRDEAFAREGSRRGSHSRDTPSASVDSKGIGSRLGGYKLPPPANRVPDHLFNIILGRITDNSATVRALFHSDARVTLTYGIQNMGPIASDQPVGIGLVKQVVSGEPVDFVISGLSTNTRYFYRLTYDIGGTTRHSDEFRFHTQRSPDSPFVFTVQADLHLDENTSGEVYLQTLANASMDQPDFHFALGDTFMTGKYLKPELSQPQYLAQRYYLGHLCHSAALYFALGNHDGESGNRGSNGWATTTRKRYLPNPYPNGFFTGNSQREVEVGLPENYYQFEWGDAQFIVLDPFRHTTTRTRGGSSDNWYWTLGGHQYRWLKQSLEESDAKL